MSTTAATPAAPRTGWPFRLMLAGSLLIALASVRYLFPGAPGGAPGIMDNAFTKYGVLTVHAGFALVALTIGPFQFLKGLRARRPRLHRWMGRTYVLACLVAGAAGLVLALGATTGLVSTAGFGLLAVLWLFTTTKAWTSAMNRRFDEHRRWMIRSFALTFAAVTLRLYLPFAFFSPFGYDDTYRAISFLCWVPNLAFAEVFVRVRARA
ncbi:MAG: DUF2306 domain-containing protein [Caulobacter sp.]